MSRKSDIQNYIDTSLNSNTAGVTFKLFYKYGINDDEFSELLINSVDLGDTDENNVKINFEGQEYNTQNGEFTLDKLEYIPCIIEKFSAKFQPVRTSIDTIIQYTVPVQFFVNERFNRENNDFIEDAIEQVQDIIRGQTTTIGGYNVFINHNEFSPQTGLVLINEVPFRVYQMQFFFKFTKEGYFGNQIRYIITNSELFGGVSTEIYPINMGSNRNTELQSRQIFDTDLVKEYEIKSVPDVSAYGLTLGFIYKGTELERYFTTQKENPTKPKIYNISKIYPGMEGTPFVFDYILDGVTGPEEYDGQLITVCTFSRVSEEYNG